MLLASRSQQDALPHMKTLNSASGSQLAFNNILMLSFHYFLLQVQAWVLILVSGLHGLFSSLQVPWRAKLLIHLILETLLFKYIHQPFLWTWATTWLHIFCQVPPTLGGKFKKKKFVGNVCLPFRCRCQRPPDLNWKRSGPPSWRTMPREQVWGALMSLPRIRSPWRWSFDSIMFTWSNLTNHGYWQVFIGFEYECPRGHRFMVSAPDRFSSRKTLLVVHSSNTDC